MATDDDRYMDTVWKRVNERLINPDFEYLPDPKSLLSNDLVVDKNYGLRRALTPFEAKHMQAWKRIPGCKTWKNIHTFELSNSHPVLLPHFGYRGSHRDANLPAVSAFAVC